ncbi:FGGY-family carbohydrate kinase [Amycolatopsis sp. CA-126428]|uniref:FGGY-family carbohydrate kinase n=1 Tax=Amycolatopsis sp. CA-126428 TaxID=2073158 RepID=UPI000CD29D76|nr:FGGY-family carbohydrate kinase [Amycolatopsis sp. CA-126428]
MTASGPAGRPVVVCLDAGTTVIKAAVFDEDGHELFAVSRGTTVSHPSPDRAEQDMDAVWEAASSAVREAAERLDRPVEFLALTAQGDGAWLVDGRHRPLRPAVLWNDGRAAGIVEDWRVRDVLTEAFRINASLTNAGLPNAILRALIAEEPETTARAAAVLTCGSWLFLRLTGVLGMDSTDSSAPWLDLRLAQHSDALFELYGLGPQRHLVPPLLGAADRVQKLTAEAAGLLGLPAGLPVVLAPYDIASTAIGSGATEPGHASCVLGTTLCTEVLVDSVDTTAQPAGLTLALDTPDLLLRAFPTLAGCGVIDWLAGLLGLPAPGAVTALAGQASPGADGLRILPYLSPAGERAPFLDLNASGLITGVKFGHQPEHFARAVLEGLGHVIRDCLTAAPGHPTQLRLCGGGAASSSWCQMIADITGIPAIVTTDSQVGAKGSFVHASALLGRYPDLATAAAALIRTRQRFDPVPELTGFYDGEHEEFLTTREMVSVRWPHWRTHPDAGAASEVGTHA